MESLEEKIRVLEEEIRQTPYHKGTQHHIGRLRARIAQLKEEISQRVEKGKGGRKEGFTQKKLGDATVVLVGPPSVGKSTLLNKLTHAHSKVAAYDFTTLKVIPGMLNLKGAKIQIFDIPGLIGGAAKGMGRGKEIFSVARVADLIILMIDVATAKIFDQIQNELYEAGLRLNQKIPALAVLNKIDLISQSNLFTILQSMGNNKTAVIPISAEKGIGLKNLKEKIWERLKLIRIFLKPQGREPDFQNPLILKEQETVLTAAQKIHGEFTESVKTAQVWGKSAKFPGQKVSLTHQLQDGDILTFLSR